MKERSFGIFYDSMVVLVRGSRGIRRSPLVDPGGERPVFTLYFQFAVNSEETDGDLVVIRL